MKDYRLVDWATQGYLILVALLALFFHNHTVPSWGWLAAAHVVVVGLVHALIRAHATRPDNRVLGFFRAFYPMILYTGFYRETEYLNQIFVLQYLDPWFIRLEEAIFGFQPSVLFMEKLPQRWVAELMYGAYFSYYLMIVGVGLALFFRDRRQFAHYLTVVSILFYCCYLTYIFLPVCGPRVFFEDFTSFEVDPAIRAVGHAHPMPASVAGGIFPSIILLIYRHLEAAGAAFPSSHVAVAICTAWFSWRYLPRIRWIHAVVVFLLCVSTVYCRYHYVVDVVAGTLLAFVAVPMLNRLYAVLDNPQPAPAAAPSSVHEPSRSC
ncbi:MAG: phosphatase PAP2 family protein [Verrucomicrobia bacterium]|nr:MAG: phosphatase PAP2 family protein [Verrucomicrobiota bacterium]